MIIEIDIKKYFSKRLMQLFLSQRVRETVSRSIEQLGVKISKRGLESKRLAIIAFVLLNIELPVPLRCVKWFLRGYLTGLVNKTLDELVSLLNKSKKKK